MTWRARALIGITALVAFLAVMAIAFDNDARGHDDAGWIQQQGKRNAAGEWCCGIGDCFLQEKVTYSARDRAFIIHEKLTGIPIEAVPEAEAQPSPDGAYWRCQRHDGSRRCFFAPPPNS